MIFLNYKETSKYCKNSMRLVSLLKQTFVTGWLLATTLLLTTECNGVQLVFSELPANDYHTWCEKVIPDNGTDKVTVKSVLELVR